MTGPPNGRVPALGERRDTNLIPQGDQLDQDLDLALQRTSQVEHVTEISNWPALAAWLGAVTS